MIMRSACGQPRNILLGQERERLMPGVGHLDNRGEAETFIDFADNHLGIVEKFEPVQKAGGRLSEPVVGPHNKVRLGFRAGRRSLLLGEALRVRNSRFAGLEPLVSISINSALEYGDRALQLLGVRQTRQGYP